RGSSDLELAYEDTGQGDPQVIGIRWRDIPLVASNEIVEAWVRFQVDETKGGTEPVNLLIEGELAPDSAPFADEAFNVTSRARTEANVQWSVPDWTNVGDQGPDQTTPDVTAIVEEIINQEEWAAGNALGMIFSDDPCNPSTGIRAAEAAPDGGSALLHVIAITEAASAPSPANGAIDVDQDVVLAWAPGFSGVSRDVYFGTDENPPKAERTTGTSYDVGKLAVSTTYYWKIDEYDADGNKTEGAVFSFTTVIGEAVDPSPASMAAGVAVDAVLSWTPGGTSVSSDVYFGVGDALELMGNQVEDTFDPNGLEMDTVYSWRVDSIEEDGTTHVGDVWTFKTAGANAGAKAQYFKGMNFEDPVLSRTDALINFAWGDGAPDPAVGADSFSVRWIADLVPAFSDTYTLATRSDDGVRVWLDGELIIDNWTDHGSTWDLSEPVELAAGESYLVQMEYYENGGGAIAELHWESPTTARRFIGALQAPLFALDPDPADGSTLLQTFALLSWTAGPTAVSHDLYISENMDDVVAGAEAAFGGNLTTTSTSVGLPGLPIPDGLGGATYYWRIDEVEADPNVVHEGLIWSFTVPPASAYNPSPADGAENVDAGVTLSWTGGLGAKLHSVYFGDDLDTVTNAVGAPPLPLTTFNPGPLEAGKTYYWRVDEFNPPNNVTGAVWSFTVAP
ncbi:MAG: PA14 domain-containing protein, partial [Planctomycetota bacterium]